MIKRESLKVQAYNYLKKEIIEGNLKAGELYTEMALAEKLNISRTPIREAVLQLVHEDYVSIRPNKGFVVRQYSNEEIMEYFQVRKAIEGFCAMESVKEKDSQKWHDFIESLESYVSATENNSISAEEFMEYDAKFHIAIVEFEKNLYMTNVMKDMRGRIHRLGVKSFNASGRKNDTMTEHRAIVEAIKNGSKMDIYSAIERHFDESFKAIEKYVEN